MKARRSNTKISTVGGLVPILDNLNKLGVPELINDCLPKRRHNAKFKPSDIFIGWTATALSGGTRLEHFKRTKNKLSIIPNLNMPSPDTAINVMKKLATETQTSEVISHTKNAEVRYTDYNINDKLNEMLVKVTKRIGGLKENIEYTLDIDATFLKTEKRGAARRYNKEGKLDFSRIGFLPMVCLVQNMPIHIEMRNGNAGSKFQLDECLKRALKNTDDLNIKISRVISDAAGYSKGIMEMLDDRGMKFNIRFPYHKKMETFKTELRKCKSWRPTTIRTANNIWDCEIGDITYTMFNSEKKWRVVTMRMPKEKLQEEIDFNDEVERKKNIKKKMLYLAKKGVLKEEGKTYTDKFWKEVKGKEVGKYKYKFLITNDFEKTSEQIVDEYNKRGFAERQFSFMKKDFAWRLPPYMNMNHNAVFLIAAAFANNVFRSMAMRFKEHVPEIDLNSNLEEFRTLIIEVSCAFIEGVYEFYSENIAFEKLM